MRKILVALALGAASIVPVAIDQAAPASAALPVDQCVANGGNYYTCLYRWLACGPYWRIPGTNVWRDNCGYFLG